MSEHTPGPWYASRDEGSQYHFVSTSTVVVADTRACIAATGEELAESVSESNARLIAAAPDMLAALEDIANDLGDLMRHCNKEGNAEQARLAWAQARDVIAEARGAE